jgi:protein-tyrosine phosphatase
MRTSQHWVETGERGRMAIMSRPRAGDWLEDEVAGLRDAGVQVVVSLLTDEEVLELGLEQEEALCRGAGLSFLRLPIPDREVPPLDPATAHFVGDLRDALVAGASVVIHCRMGIGRSSLIAAAALVLLGVDADEAFARLSAARGLAVPDTEAQRAWVTSFARSRPS